MKPLYWTLSALGLLGQATAYLISPNGTAAPGSAEDCSSWFGYEKGVTCQMVEVLYEITAAEFEEWNPIVTEVGSGCALIPDLYFCVEVDFVPGTYTSLPSNYLSYYPTVSVSTSLLSAISMTSTSTSTSASTSISTASSTSHSSSTSQLPAPASATTPSSGSMTATTPIQCGTSSTLLALLSGWMIVSALTSLAGAAR
ncbi:hypothetical protein N7507_000080 [Penicillium longicatenatum]|nr:hypothetical protein N7507_000080 [Penicillium longicatenatum]